MTGAQAWTTADFAAMSWHDARVHGFRLVDVNAERGRCDLVFDIDYILEWTDVAGAFEFRVAQASLRFHDVFGLRMNLDYREPGAGMCAFSLDGVARRPHDGYVGWFWEIDVNWPSGRIEFDASGFTQTLVGPIRQRKTQGLDSKDRV